RRRHTSSTRDWSSDVCSSDLDYRAKAVILTGGADYNRLGVPGEERLTGFGVSYCGTCDAAFFKDMDVAVVGGGDAAMDESMFIKIGRASCRGGVMVVGERGGE